MKVLKLFAALGFVAMAHGAAVAQDLTIYYSPTCPHCHHALEFINKTLVADYADLKVQEVNVSQSENRQKFMDAVKDCKLQGGYIPLVVIGDKCFQGFGQNTGTEYIAALGAANADTDTTVTAEQLPEEQLPAAPQTDKNNSTMLYILLGLLVVALGVLLFTRKKK